MTNQNNAAQAANENPLSDEYVNAIIQCHGYDSPETVIARLAKWIGLSGGEDGVTLLMYEAHKALSKLRAPVADERAAFEADHIRRFNKPGLLGWDEVGMFAGTFGHALTRARWEGWQARAALASAPVADEQKEISGVTLDGCLETLFRVGEHLGIDYAESRKQPGAPSGIYIKAIEDRVSKAMNEAREEAAKLMDQTSRSSGAGLIRSLASAPADERKACATYVCQAGRADGVLCANDECDRANGVRPASAPVAGDGMAHIRLLTTDHSGTRVDYTGLLGQSIGTLKRGGTRPDLAEMLRQLAGHLKELGQRWYAGDTAVVDEILQLYCIESDARAALSAQPGAQKEQSDAN